MKIGLAKTLAAIKSGVAATVPGSMYRAMLKRAFSQKQIALCLHRVAKEYRATDPYPDNTFIEQDLIVFLDALYALVPDTHLVITFDDGYHDATEFVSQYAGRYPKAAFILFVCPEKVIHRAGFRWDLYEAEGGDFAAILKAEQSIAAENHRQDLRRVAADPRFQLSTAEQLRTVAGIDNVSLGNHSNCHFNFARLTEADWKRELELSFALFAELFGHTEHFAFPFGTPKIQFKTHQAQFIRDHYGVNVWSTGKGSNLPDGDSAYLNRFALAGYLPLKNHFLQLCRHS